MSFTDDIIRRSIARPTGDPAKDAALHILAEKLPDTPDNTMLRRATFAWINFYTANIGDREHIPGYQMSMENSAKTMLAAFKAEGRFHEGVIIRKEIKTAMDTAPAKETENGRAGEKVIYLGRG